MKDCGGETCRYLGIKPPAIYFTGVCPLRLVGTVDKVLIS